MTQEIEPELEEEDVIDPIEYELGTASDPPLTSGHLPFNKMGLTLPLEDMVMDVCYVTFNQLMKRVVQER